MKTKTCTFFGGAVNDTTTQEYNDSVIIGEYLGNLDYTIKNGGYRGLMEAISKGVNKTQTLNKSKSKVIGYTCKTFGYTKGNKYLNETVVCDDIYDRLRMLIKDSDLFIIQAGGIGTFSELLLLLDETRKFDIFPDIYIFGDMWKNTLNNLNSIIPKKILNKIKFCDNYTDFIIKFGTKNN